MNKNLIKIFDQALKTFNSIYKRQMDVSICHRLICSFREDGDYDTYYIDAFSEPWLREYTLLCQDYNRCSKCGQSFKPMSPTTPKMLMIALAELMKSIAKNFKDPSKDGVSECLYLLGFYCMIKADEICATPVNITSMNKLLYNCYKKLTGYQGTEADMATLHNVMDIDKRAMMFMWYFGHECYAFGSRIEQHFIVQSSKNSLLKPDFIVAPDPSEGYKHTNYFLLMDKLRRAFKDCGQLQPKPYEDYLWKRLPDEEPKGRKGKEMLKLAVHADLADLHFDRMLHEFNLVYKTLTLGNGLYDSKAIIRHVRSAKSSLVHLSEQQRRWMQMELIRNMESDYQNGYVAEKPVDVWNSCLHSLQQLTIKHISSNQLLTEYGSLGKMKGYQLLQLWFCYISDLAKQLPSDPYPRNNAVAALVDYYYIKVNESLLYLKRFDNVKLMKNVRSRMFELIRVYDKHTGVYHYVLSCSLTTINQVLAHCMRNADEQNHTVETPYEQKLFKMMGQPDATGQHSLDGVLNDHVGKWHCINGCLLMGKLVQIASNTVHSRRSISDKEFDTQRMCGQLMSQIKSPHDMYLFNIQRMKLISVDSRKMRTAVYSKRQELKKRKSRVHHRQVHDRKLQQMLKYQLYLLKQL